MLNYSNFDKSNIATPLSEETKNTLEHLPGWNSFVYTDTSLNPFFVMVAESPASTSTGLFKPADAELLDTALREQPHVLIGFDTEFHYISDKDNPHRRSVLCWSFSASVDDGVPASAGARIVEGVIFPLTAYRLSATSLVSVVLNLLGVRFEKASEIERDSETGKPVAAGLPVYLAAHNLTADFGTLRDCSQYYTRGQDVGAGFSTNPMKLLVYRESKCKNARVCTIRFVDTMSFFPSSLADIGADMGYPKIDDERLDKKHMDKSLRDYPEIFTPYALRDASIVHGALDMYAGHEMPASIPALGAKLVLSVAFDNDRKRLRQWTGYRKEERRVYEDDVFTRTETEYVPATRLAKFAEDCCRVCYMGGFNGSVRQGLYRQTTYDWDLKNAYPTALSMFPDLDLSEGAGELLVPELNDQVMFTFGFGYVGFGYATFEFPDTVRFPCIGISNDHGIVYPRRGVEVLTDWQSVRLARLMGATVTLKDFKMLPLRLVDGKPVYSLMKAYVKLIESRSHYHKKTLPNTTLKLAANAIYGKTGQAVRDKRRRSYRTEGMEDIDLSSMSNPSAADFSTAMVRAMLCATMEQVEADGYHCYSVTTDGFITDCPDLNAYDAYGLRDFFLLSRQMLGDTSGAVWEKKHEEPMLLNLTTRANYGFYRDFTHDDGQVEAHTGYAGDNFLVDYLKRPKDGIHHNGQHQVNLHEQAAGAVYEMVDTPKKLRFNYDFKRYPIAESISEEHIEMEGEDFTVLNFDTRPYETIEEYQTLRAHFNNLKVCIFTANELRAVMDWKNLSVEQRKQQRIRRDEWRQAVNELRIFPEFELRGKMKAGRASMPKAEILRIVNEVLAPYSDGWVCGENYWDNATKSSRLQREHVTGLTRDLAQQMYDAIVAYAKKHGYWKGGEEDE